MNSNLQLVTQENFGAVQCDFYKQDDEVWMTREQIGAALEYEFPRQAIGKIHERHQERLEKFSAVVSLTSPSGNQETVVYSPKGVYEICRWSRQPKANAFYDWVYEVLEKLRTKQATLLESSMAEILQKTIAAIGRNADLIIRNQELSFDLHRRIASLEQERTKGQDYVPPTMGGVAFPAIPPLPTGGKIDIPRAAQALTIYTDFYADILRAVYAWAQANRDKFYSLGHPYTGNPLHCPGRWDKGQWQYIAFYPDILRGLLRTRFSQSNPEHVLITWRDRGWLKTNRRENRTTNQLRMPRGERTVATRMIVIKQHPLRMAREANSN